MADYVANGVRAAALAAVELDGCLGAPRCAARADAFVALSALREQRAREAADARTSMATLWKEMKIPSIADFVTVLRDESKSALVLCAADSDWLHRLEEDGSSAAVAADRTHAIDVVWTRRASELVSALRVAAAARGEVIATARAALCAAFEGELVLFTVTFHTRSCSQFDSPPSYI